MKDKYYILTTTSPEILRLKDNLVYIFNGFEWVENDYWFHQLFFSDFSDYKEVSYDEAMFELGKKVAS